MIKLLTGQDALSTYTFLRDPLGANMSVNEAAAFMQRAWLRGKARSGPIALSVAALNSDGAENAVYEIGIHLPGRRSRL